MAYDNDRLNRIFDRTDGRCHLCWGGLTFSAYGDSAHPRSWEVEHSRPRALGGTDRLSNLYAAHIPCNRSKGTVSTRAARSGFGFTRAPMSADAKSATIARNAVFGGLLAGGLAALLASTRNEQVAPHERTDPLAAFLLGGAVGAAVGSQIAPE